MRQERGGIFSLFSLVARVATRDLQQIFSPKSLRATQTYILGWVDGGNPSFLGWIKQRVIKELLISH